ncbi:MAG: PaaI family thioesterase [Pseudomonadota bacterium]
MSKLDPEIAAKVQASFAAQGMMATLGAKITEVTAGSCTIEAPIRPETGQQQGFAHAGLTFSIGDSAAGYAALTLMPKAAEVVTAEMKINLLAPATGDRLVAVGRVIRPGRRLVVVQSDVYALGETRRHVALLTGTMVPVLAQPGAPASV